MGTIIESILMLLLISDKGRTFSFLLNATKLSPVFFFSSFAIPLLLLGDSWRCHYPRFHWSLKLIRLVQEKDHAPITSHHQKWKHVLEVQMSWLCVQVVRENRKSFLGLFWDGVANFQIFQPRWNFLSKSPCENIESTISKSKTKRWRTSSEYFQWFQKAPRMMWRNSKPWIKPLGETM